MTTATRKEMCCTQPAPGRRLTLHICDAGEEFINDLVAPLEVRFDPLMQLSICEFRTRVADDLSGVWQEPAKCTSPWLCSSSNMATTGRPAKAKRSSRLGDGDTPAAVQSEQRRKGFLLRQIACAASGDRSSMQVQSRRTGAHLMRKGVLTRCAKHNHCRHYGSHR